MQWDRRRAGEITPSVVDSGSGMCKAEFAGDAKPRVVFPSPGGGPCEQNIAIKSFHKSVCLSVVVVVVEEEACA